MDLFHLLKKVKRCLGKEVLFSLRELRQLQGLKEDIDHLQGLLERSSDELMVSGKTRLLLAYYQGKSGRDLRHIKRIEKRLNVWIKKLQYFLALEENHLSLQERQEVAAFLENIEICKRNLVRICARGGELQTLLGKAGPKASQMKKKIDEAMGDEKVFGLRTLIILSQQLERYTGVLSFKGQQQLLEEDKYPQFEAGYLRVGGRKIDIRKKLPYQLSSEDSSKMVIDEERLAQQTSGRRYSVLHTHPRTEQQAKKWPSFQSDVDFLDFLGRQDMKTCIVAQRDPRTGVVAGYFFLRKTARTPVFSPKPLDDEKGQKEWENTPAIRALLEDIEQVYRLWPDPEKDFFKREMKKQMSIQADFLRFCKKYHLQFRAVPVKGFAFKKGAGFVRDKKK